MANGQLADPPTDCGLCPRLVDFRRESQAKQPDWFNGAVASFGDPKARLLIVGLAPGLSGANRTARPFTGDFAGDLLYQTLASLAVEVVGSCCGGCVRALEHCLHRNLT